ncbi:hypothetical protein GCM10018793_24890 [Streptomyces sulfonofaciens]|uniref:Uncharacterized protein n=1 Tax=Streptomyces sulfonofaciens TaxID=68272 RepID=A0A919KYC9_9ACTN|nr:hypothetical protein GCM10018793_24890 [Streptomyces sulfonofaciens]
MVPGWLTPRHLSSSLVIRTVLGVTGTPVLGTVRCLTAGSARTSSTQIMRVPGVLAVVADPSIGFRTGCGASVAA